MKILLSFTFVVFFFVTTTSFAQQEYTVDGKQYTLLTEIDGPLTLLWNTIDGEYRYFSKKDGTILELKNTKIDGDYQEEYKDILKMQTQDITGVDASDVKFTRPSLSSFFVTYNKVKDINFTYESKAVQLQTRLGAFAGGSNNVYSSNVTNAITPAFGIDFEVLDEVTLRRHSVVLQFKQLFKNPDNNSTSSQFSLNYRFKFVKSAKFDVYINTKFVAYTYSKTEVTVVDPISETSTIVSNSGGNFNAPAAFGIGADYAVGNGYITFNYNDIVAVGVDNEDGNFPVDFTLGYKFNL